MLERLADKRTNTRTVIYKHTVRSTITEQQTDIEELAVKLTVIDRRTDRLIFVDRQAWEHMDSRKLNTQADIKRHRRTGRWTDRQSDRQIDSQTDR